MNLLNKTGLTYFWGKLKAYFAKGNGRIFYGTCDTAAGTAAKVVTCPYFTSGDLENGTMLLVKFAEANTASVENLTLNVNNTGAYSIKKVYSEGGTDLTMPGEIRGITHLFVFSRYSDGSTLRWYIVGVDVNTTYLSMTQTEIDAGTGTNGRRITPKLLRDNFYTETEVDALLTNRPTIVHLSDESDMPATPDANTIYMIDE